MYIVNSEQMYAAECNAVEDGITFPMLMENAGRASADIIFDNYCGDGKKNCLILCGKGKNGGDGFVIARALCEKGCAVTVLITSGKPVDSDQLENFNKISDFDIYEYNGNFNNINWLIDESDVIVDAIFGTGFRGKLDDKLTALAELVNTSGKPVAAVDVPSGACCDSATAEGTTFRADITIAVSALKPIHVIKPYNALCGKVFVAYIGITDENIENTTGYICETLNENDISLMLPERITVSNKGTYGHAVCLCGSRNMTGAACMSTMGALRTGAGLVTTVFPKSAYSPITAKITEAVTLPVSENENGTFCEKSIGEIDGALKKATAVLVGCGMGNNSDTAEFTKYIFEKSDAPVVADADALNVISTHPEILDKRPDSVVLTPHPGEMSRLCGKSIEEILENPVETAVEYAKKHNVTLALKGANTVVTDGKRIYINTTGNPGLSKGGSGDLLAGMIVSLIAQGMEPYEAAVCGVFMHGDCADELAEKTSMRGMLVTDMIDYLPKYYGKFE